jgi:hypothetical protein
MEKIKRRVNGKKRRIPDENREYTKSPLKKKKPFPSEERYPRAVDYREAVALLTRYTWKAPLSDKRPNVLGHPVRF